MCGIAGIIGRVDDRNREALSRMASAMSHRGPDGQGTWASPPDDPGRGCLLAHRRLSILDLSAAADQPMVDPESGSCLVFNGEIYNFPRLRDDLRAEGASIRSTGDTEVLLRALARRGPDAVSGLRGMFAFAWWDESNRRLVLARDPLGIKPLYVAANPEGPGGDWDLAFASEVRALLASGLLGAPRLDPAALACYLWNGFVPGPITAVRGVESLRPGELRVLDAGGRTRRSEVYWSIPRPGPGNSGGPKSNGHPGPIDASLGDALQESVGLHLVSDVPLGVFLSGGIDSGAVANLAQRASSRPVRTFTLAFEELELSEAPYSRAIASAIGSEHHEVVLTGSRFTAELPRALDAIDQPTFDALNTYFMSVAVREAGLTVALVGTGGDELFGGYTSFRDLPTLHRWAERTRWLPSSAKQAAALAIATARGGRARGPVPPQTRWAKLPEMVAAGPDLLRLYQLAYALFLPEMQAELMPEAPADGSVRFGLPADLADRLSAEAEGRGTLEAISVMEQRCFLGERLLRDSDAAGMAPSLEIRLPLVDHVLLEHVCGMPTGPRYDPVGRKAALRRAGLVGLDPALFDRPKRGFELPLEHWIRSSLGEEIDDLLRDHRAVAAVGLDGPAVERLWDAFRAGAPGLYWSRIWSLYAWIRWCHAHGVLL
jgi:asparagine synthase (glutamine-hydrolysing)